MTDPHYPRYCACKLCLDSFFQSIRDMEGICRERRAERPLKRWEMNRLLPRADAVRARMADMRERYGTE